MEDDYSAALYSDDEDESGDEADEMVYELPADNVHSNNSNDNDSSLGDDEDIIRQKNLKSITRYHSRYSKS